MAMVQGKKARFLNVIIRVVFSIAISKNKNSKIFNKIKIYDIFLNKSNNNQKLII